MERAEYRLFDEYQFDVSADRVQWMRIFSDQRRLMRGRGVFRDDVLVLLHPYRIDDITDESALRDELSYDSLPVWDKTTYLVHLGNERQGFPVQDAIEIASGRHLEDTEIQDLVTRIQDVFPEE